MKGQFKYVDQIQKALLQHGSVFMCLSILQQRFWYTRWKEFVVWPVSVLSIDCALDNDLQCPAGAALKSKLKL